MSIPVVLLLCFLAGGVFVNTIWSAFVWDDRAAVWANPDVNGGRPASAALLHDFWGQDITSSYVSS